MSLSTALSIAQNSLLNTQRQVSVVSQNVANAQNTNYSRRDASISSLAPGTQVVEIRRATNAALFKQNLSAISGYTAQSLVSEGLTQLTLSVNGTDNALSPATALGDLETALQLYSASPSNPVVAQSAVEAARQAVRTLNEGTQAIQSFQAQTDAQIATAVNELNSLLGEFKTANDEIVSGTRAGRDVNDALDRRDALLKQIADYVPISTITRADNDLMIVTGDGATLFETVPRHVGFSATPVYGPSTTGNGITIDGVPVSPGQSGNTTASGSLGALLQLRDSIAPAMQLQLDEVARGLIVAFAETDPAGGTTAPGLFTWSGAPDVPDDGVSIQGLAGQITLNAAIDPEQGGNVELLRDGANFDLNADDNASFNEAIDSYLVALRNPVTFTSASGAVASMGLMDYSTEAISWVEANRKDATSGAETKSALMVRTMEALSNVTHVNVDEEMALLLELEHSYSASAMLLQTIDNMLATLLEAVR